MANAPDKKEEIAAATSLSPRAIALLQGMGLVFSHSSLYGMSHSVTTKGMESCFATLTEILREKNDINISVNEEELLVDGIRVESSLPAVRTISQRLTALSIASFSLTQGITLQELANVFELLQATPDEMRAAGGFAAVIATVGLPHVRSKRVTIQQVTEDEVVVSKEKLSQVVGTADTANVVRFLKGEIDSSAPGIGETLMACSADAEQAGELVLQAAALSPGADPGDHPGKIVEAVRRLYDNVAGGAGGQTQKGKKALVKFLEQLEGSLVDNLRKAHGGELPEAEAQIAQSLEEMKDELRIDALAAEYAKKRGAITTSEKRILRYIETVGWSVAETTGLKDRLIEEGLTPDEWDDLLEKSGAGDKLAETLPDYPDRLAARSAAVSDLVSSLSRLGVIGGQSSPATPAPATEDIDRVLTQVGDAVAKLVDQTQKKIDGFSSKVKASREGRQSPGISRKAIVEFLAEIVQELRQPLAVIMSVVDSMNSGMLGSMTAQQSAMLGLAASSAQRLDLLISKVAEISGMPTELSPDAKILDAVYKDRKNTKP